jgi:hypothetical protein
MGAWLPEGAGYGENETCLLHRAFVRSSAQRRLLSGEKLWPRMVLSERLARGEEGARLPLAAQLFDLGDYDGVLEILGPIATGADARQRFLVGFALLARGEREAAGDVFTALGSAQGISPGASAILRAVLPEISAP